MTATMQPEFNKNIAKQKTPTYLRRPDDIPDVEKGRPAPPNAERGK